jgi:hypothetical protein
MTFCLIKIRIAIEKYGTQHNDSQNNMKKYDTQQNDSRHNIKKYDTQQNDT